MSQGYVKLSVEQAIGWVEFFHPASNSMPGDLLRELAQVIEKAGKDQAIKVIVLKSAGEKAFCAGASFDELAAITDLKEGDRFFSGFAQVINAIRKADKFVIGRVHGKAVGGGVGIASAVDYCFATKHAEVKLSELAVGIGPFVVGPAVERKIGTSAFSELSIHATQWRSANWAKEKGLFMDVFDSTEQMDNALLALALELAKSSSDAMRELKKVLWAGTENWDQLLLERAAISGRLVLSDFTKNFIALFKKRV